jgi:hypothetical protein
MEIERGWRKIFRTFSSLKTLFVDDESIEELPPSRCLRVDDGGHPLELLCELQELELPYSQVRVW